MFITLAILAIVDFFFSCINLWTLYDNEYFDPIYPNVYAVLLIVLLVAVVLLLIYLIAPDSRGTRKILPYGYLVYGIGGILIGLWVIVYIAFIYKRDKVYIKDYSYQEDDV